MIGGGIWPVVHRELRAGARRPFNHWLRVAGALGGLGILWMRVTSLPFSTVGGQIFAGIHRLMLLLILCVVPAITADCIARERREGTLGLLFLTPLRSWEIVIGKVAVQVLKMLTLWLAVVPVLTIPFLSGGVTVGQLAGDLDTELCVGMFCLAAGIVASSLTDKRSMAITLAFVLTATLVFGLTEERGWRLLRVNPVTVATGWVSRYRAGTPGVVIWNYYYSRLPTVTARVPAAGGSAVISYLPLAGRLVFSSLVLWCAIRFAGIRVERSWMDKVPSAAGRDWAKFCGAPVFRRRFELRMRRTLEWNPIAWLQQYSWRARLTRWGLCLAFTVLICMASEAGEFNGISERETIVFAILSAAYTYAGVNGFLREKKSGALELILVTPLTINEVIFGRVWGLWKQFFPAAVVLALCDVTVRWLDPFRHGRAPDYYYGASPALPLFNADYTFSDWVSYVFASGAPRDIAVILGFIALPVYSTLSALRVKNIVMAAAFTWLNLMGATVAGVVIPLAAALLAGGTHSPSNDFAALSAPGVVCAGILLAHVALVAFSLRSLREKLAQRDYSF